MNFSCNLASSAIYPCSIYKSTMRSKTQSSRDGGKRIIKNDKFVFYYCTGLHFSSRFCQILNIYLCHFKYKKCTLFQL